MRIGLISDTHGQLRPQIFDHFRAVQLILHAGDVGDQDVLTQLETLAPVHAVIGNTDTFPLLNTLPEVQELELLGRRVVITHGHRLGSLTPALLRHTHPSAQIIVYGHTHKPYVGRTDGTLIVNPGAAGPARFRLKPSIAILEWNNFAEEIVHLIEL
ncbi:MAG: metallophosphoesterase family protein [Longimicrobiales bacterium]